MATKTDKKSETKALKKTDGKKQKNSEPTKSDLKAEAKMLKKALAEDTALAEKAAAKAKKQLKKERGKVRAQLLKAKELAEKIAKKDEARARKLLKKKNTLVEEIAATVEIEAEKLEKAAEKSPATPTPVAESVSIAKRAPATRTRSRVPNTGTSAVRASTEPSESWTMVALRSYAGSNGITGYSRLNKSELLAKLRGIDALD